ncbi:ABC transporter permease [Mycobacterium sp. MYCO198283]|uniref:ABC transporter permease n=1 Tax=Mycobacterium sp. MYCO198283 TaxID=2883505 RepID=UPI001E60CC32|nr:ABC transporter permease [Mycobacterium sp. MYCO198283]MCG5432198.1 ABC transporter permease [Mycobacterium sp. MYCO198283]
MTAVGDALAAERIKLATTRSPLWCAVVVAVVSLGTAAALGAAGSEWTPVTPNDVAMGLAAVGVPVLMVVAALTVTGEYRTGLIRTTLLAIPNRTIMIGAKALLAVLVTVPFTAALMLLSLLAAKGQASAAGGMLLDLGSAAAWRPVWAVAVYAGLAVVLAIGVAALVRHSAGAVAVLLLWPFVLEPVLAVLPSTSGWARPLLPFTNAFAFTDVPWLYVTDGLWWGPTGSLVYFAVVAVAVFVAGAVVVNRRDA